MHTISVPVRNLNARQCGTAAFAILVTLARAFDLRVNPGGAPPPGSGTFEVRGFVRVIDGDTLDTYLRGSRTGVGIVGIAAPPITTPCGKQSAAFLSSLLRAGTKRFLEDPSAGYDERKRRMYKVEVNGKAVGLELVRAGLARASGRGLEAAQLAIEEAQARAAGRGCIHAPGLNGDDRVTPQAGAPIAAAASTNTILPGGFYEEVVVSGLSLPTAFTFLPDGRILVAEQSGLVKVVKGGAVLPTPLIDLRQRVNFYWDRGMLGIAADAQFATNGYVYLAFTYENDPSRPGATKTARVARYTVNGDVAEPASEMILLGTTGGDTCTALPAGSDCIGSDAPSHTIGNIKSAADGTLYVTVGDGANFNVVDDLALRAQDLDSLNGKLLHITNTGAGLPGNPFWNGSATANRSKVFAYGFRNPFRFNLRPNTTAVYVGDVGWSWWEEVDAVLPGANLGWPCYEGFVRQSGYEPKTVCQSLYTQGGGAAAAMPLTVFDHSSANGAAVAGGAFYSGSAFPSAYQGAYFFGDYGSQRMRVLRADSNNNLTSGPNDFAFKAGGVVDIQMGPDLELYYLAIDAGQVRRVRYSGADTAAPAVVSTSPAADATGAPSAAAITATFSELIDAASVGTNSFAVTEQGSTTPVAATVTFDGANLTALLKPAAELRAGTNYTAVIKGGAAGIRDIAGNSLPGDKSWTFRTSDLTTAPPGTTFISDWSWLAMTNGWGPAEKNQSNGENSPGDGQTILLNGVSYAKGLGVHAASDIRYNLGGACSSFTSDIGVDDEVGINGSVVFKVIADDRELYVSPLLNGASAPQQVNASLANADELRLVVTDGDGSDVFDHADWANARITCAADAKRPSLRSTSPSAGAVGVPIAAVVGAAFSESMNVNSINSSTFTVRRSVNGSAISGAFRYFDGGRSMSFVPSAPFEEGTQYTVTIKGGAGGVADLAGNPLSSDFTWSFSVTGGGQPTTQYLSDMSWNAMTNGWGPAEKDRSNGESGAGDGNTLILNGVSYGKGLGVHAPSDIRYNLAGSCSTFTAAVGVDDEVGPDGSITFQVWADGLLLFDSGVMTGSSPTRTASVDLSGKSELALIVTDGGDSINYDHGDWADAKINCTATGTNTKPQPVINSPSPTLLYKVGDVITFSGTATDKEDGTLPAGSLSWAIIIHHCPSGTCHTHPFTSATGLSGSFTVPDHGDDSYFEIVLTATDKAGAQASTSVSLQPQTVQITLATSPAGLQVVYGTDVLVGPTTRSAVVGGLRTLSAPSPQGQNVFSSWSDGGNAQHNITIGPANSTYTATFASTADTAPPVISSVLARTITASGAVITWSTNEASDSRVEYGLTTSYGSSSPLDPALVTAHSVNLAGLLPGTLYHYRVRSRDAAGNGAVSANFTFTTSTPDTTPPILSAIRATPDRTRVTIAWTTNELSDTQVEFGRTSSYGTFTPLQTAPVTAHSTTITDLRRRTLYHYRVRSRDASGNLAVSPSLTFTTQ